MNNQDGKFVVLVCKSGPAFEKAAEDELRAGMALDRLDVPRVVGGRVLSLAERVNWLLDQRQPGSIDLSVANSDSAYINAR